MKTKNKLLVPIVGLLTTFLVPDYAAASVIDISGQSLSFSASKIALVTCPAHVSCPSDGNGPLTVSSGGSIVGTKYKYSSVISGVDATVEIVGVTTAGVSKFDDNAPSSYAPPAGVPAGADVFGPNITTTAAGGHVDFLISFLAHGTNTPISLLNVNNNTIDNDDNEYVEYGGFQSYSLNATTDLKVTAGSGTTARISQKTPTHSYSGLIFNDVGRIQTRFNSMTSLRISMGSLGTESTGRQYGSIFTTQAFASGVTTTAPTVNLLTTSNTLPTLTGTIGGAGTGSAIGSESFNVTVNGKKYSYRTDGVTISNTTWSLNLATAKYDATGSTTSSGSGMTALPLGTYEVVATRNGFLTDQTSNELVIITSCSNGTVWDSASSTCQSTTPIGNKSICHRGEPDPEPYTQMSILTTDYSHVADQYDLDPMPAGGCPSVSCPTDQEKDSSGNCITIPTPTITSIAGQGIPTRTEITTPTIIGTIGGSSSLGSDAFTVTLKLRSGTATPYTYTAVTGGTYTAGDGHLTVANTTWTLNPSTALAAGVYDVVVSRAGKLDSTTDELTLGISICDNTVDQYILRNQWETNGKKEGTTYYLGKCNGSLPSIYHEPAALSSDTVTSPSDVTGAPSTASITAATIKLATVKNATTIGGTPGSFYSSTTFPFRYAVKTPSVGSMDIINALIDSSDTSTTLTTNTEGRTLSGVTLTGVTLTNVYLGQVNSTDSNYSSNPTTGTIAITGGSMQNSSYVSTLCTALNQASPCSAAIVDGMITAGTDPNGNPVRGRIASGQYDLAQTVPVDAKRITGTLTGATITNAKTTTSTSNGVTTTIVGSGTITAGTFTSPTSFGSVTGATITGADITNTTHYFASGTVGSRGSLNWKEKTKE
jgi:hypothetical protein